MAEQPDAARLHVARPSAVRATAHTFVDRLDDRCVVTGDDGHHLQRVRRVRPGEVVTVADGHGRWREYEVVATGGDGLELVARSDLRHEPRLEPSVTVACALTKGERPELVVQKVTELGADGVLLVRAARSVVRWDAARALHALERLQRVAREAAAQCRRARIPVVDGVIGVDELAQRAGLVVADPGGARPGDLPRPRDGGWVVAVGPEGGFDDDELAALGAAPRLGLGPHVLRAETAAIAATAALVAERSEW